MPGSLAELYGALLKQEPQGILGAARFNPLMMAKALRQQEANPRPALSSLMNYPQTWQQFGDNIQANYPIDSPAAVRQAAFEAAKNAGPLMTVWQGSPHRFAPTKNNPLGEFDATKIGSGEGAQAYGYGHYLAENPAVASEYITAGKNMGFLNWDTPDQIATKAFAVSKGDKNAAMKFIEENIASMKSGAKKENFEIAKKILSEGRQSGSLYKVDLPDEHIGKMLDWDKPLSQQPESVRKAIERISPKNRSGQSMVSLDASGEELMRALGGGEGASNLLREAGIPGIRYLDGGSRAGGQGTSNFVVFPGNEGILKILARE